MDPLAVAASKACTELSKIQQLRIDDIMQLKTIIKLNDKSSYSHQTIITLCRREQDRRARENEMLSYLKTPEIVCNKQVTKTLQQITKRIAQIAGQAQNAQLHLLMEVKADSHAHCEQVMEEEIDYTDTPSNLALKYAKACNEIAAANVTQLSSM
jgi:hypothetical protein